jgi:hypothetical protein
MKVIFTARGPFPPFRYILRCAVERAGCEVLCISDTDYRIGTHVPIDDFNHSAVKWRKQFTKFPSELAESKKKGIGRWFILREFLDRMGGNEPIFLADWDVFVTRNVNDSFAHLLNYDLAIVGGQSSYGIFNRKALRAFTDFIFSISKNAAPIMADPDTSDMRVWQWFRDISQYSYGHMDVVHDGAVFDANLYVRFLYEQDGSDIYGPEYAPDPYRTVIHNDDVLYAKKIEVINGDPYFVSARNPERKILANSIHCWNSSRKFEDIPNIANSLGMEP